MSNIIFQLKGIKKLELDTIIKDELNRIWDLKQTQTRAKEGLINYDDIIFKMNDIIKDTNMKYLKAIYNAYNDYLLKNRLSNTEDMALKIAKNDPKINKIFDENKIAYVDIAMEAEVDEDVRMAIEENKDPDEISLINVKTQQNVKKIVDEFNKTEDKLYIITSIMKELNEPIFEAILRTFKFMNYEELVIILNANKKVILGLLSVVILGLIGSGGSIIMIKAIIDLIISETKKKLISENPSNIKLIK